MQLNFQKIHLHHLMKKQLQLKITVADDVGDWVLDEQRVKQILIMVKILVSKKLTPHNIIVRGVELFFYLRTFCKNKNVALYS